MFAEFGEAAGEALCLAVGGGVGESELIKARLSTQSLLYVRLQADLV